MNMFAYVGVHIALMAQHLIDPYHRNIVDKVQIAAGFVFDERVNVCLFELGHEYVCVCRSTYCSHGTAFDLKVNFDLKSKSFSVKISAKNVVITCGYGFLCVVVVFSFYNNNTFVFFICLYMKLLHPW